MVDQKVAQSLPKSAKIVDTIVFTVFTLNMMGYFVIKFASKNFQKSPNLITLL